ncbi:PAS domain-containing hybrid sensor histidine kinase/response regulator [Extibacter muris]|uniref:PAS domain-containing hybrid sensor histidine kinase/response regulator n=1 Tax=Extibacter muris TaxID=1796622 RepID=UPI001D06D24A|nr:PAS domain-containing hybrid sensor histidine kinase/response regulator [Extibacter muris]MCB6200469.1 PAS domain-containing protein [Extibacter muris]MCQ4663420.1 PAS domain-containing protein [Extibacter muris]MCQ4692844.1 PAS domain-containing protein [Extibacter muris]
MMEQDVRLLERELKAAKEQIQEMRMELDHLVHSIPGGVAMYEVKDGRFIPTYMSDGVPALTGHTPAEYKEEIRQGIFDHIYELDRPRVVEAGNAFLQNGEVLDISYRVRRKDGTLVWIHLNGRRMGPLSGTPRFYAVFTGTWAESRLYQNIANETADGIYVIDRDNFELLYANESKELFAMGNPCTGEKCYTALHGKTAPCAFCILNQYGADDREHEIAVDGTGRVFTARFRETDWNGIPAYIQYIRDVTEEAEARREKDRLELYCQTLIKNLPGGISVIRIEPDGSMTPEYISKGFAAMTQMTMEEAHELYLGDIFAGVHPDDVEINQNKLREFMEYGGESCEFDARFRRGDGSYVWVRDRVSVQEAPDGTRRMYCIYTDISMMMEENERMRRQYESLIMEHYRTPGADELILGHCNITQNRIIQIKDFTGSDLLKTLGNNRERFFGGLSAFIVDKQERQTFLNTYLKAPALAAFARKDTEQIQTCFVKLPGQAAGCYVQIKVNMVEAPETGDVTGVLTVTDVTDKIMSERILRKLSVTTHDYIIDANLLEGTFKVLSYNKNAHRVPKPQERYSDRVAFMSGSIIVPKDRERYTKALDPDEIRRRLQEENAYTVTYALVDEDGEIRTKNMTVFSIDQRLERVCLVCTDITDSVRALEEALAMAKKASQAKSDFLTTMSHDIRTPMNAIMGMTTLALAYSDDRERVADCLRKIQTANKHLLSLVNDVLDMSRIESSKIAMNPRPLTLSGLFGEAATIIEPQAEDAGLRFVVQNENIHRDAFYGDGLRINQVLINLLSNAVKYTPKGGRVDFLAEEVAPHARGNRVRYRFTVRDTGVGMSEDFLKRVFDPFARENTATGVEGTGLGLSIAKGLVDQMGGTISVESRIGKGTAFHIELEFEAVENPEEPGESTDGKDGLPLDQKPFSGCVFLIAEDHPINAELLCQLLQMNGAQSEITTDGAWAVREFSHAAPGTYTAVLMDIQMPVMNGYEAARAIRALDRPDAKTIPIVAMTANAFAEDVHSALDAGMNAHVAKPIDVDVLRATLGRVLKERMMKADMRRDEDG